MWPEPVPPLALQFLQADLFFLMDTERPGQEGEVQGETDGDGAQEWLRASEKKRALVTRDLHAQNTCYVAYGILVT